MEVDNVCCQLEVLDTAGQDVCSAWTYVIVPFSVSLPLSISLVIAMLLSFDQDFSALRPQWMMGKDGYIFVFGLDREGLLSVCVLHVSNMTPSFRQQSP